MALSITMKQHDTRPIANLTLQELDPTIVTPTWRAIDLTLVSSARLIAKCSSPADSFTSVLGFATPRTGGIVVWTPVAGDTDTVAIYSAEVELTYADGGIETVPGDGYFPIEIKPDLA